ncbi:DUF2207 domain-containing protein [Brevibacillus reuszeri]|uniref:DUF2207 domain-containing protein n=1 Tax=Brevibacillus reuszeri TaxID=54915 RepID=UPI002899E0A0|nr:DUF2207 domain-containing protein [Brevibacillus reuszeri]
MEKPLFRKWGRAMAIFRNIAIVLFGLLILLLFVRYYPVGERSFGISDVEIHARIDANGDMQVVEQDTYRFNGAFNGILVQLDSSGSDGLGKFQAFEVTPEQEIPLSFDQSGEDTHIQYKVYDRINDETKVFKFTYDWKNVVQVYKDTAELYWKFFDRTNPSTLGTVRIHLELPGGVKQDEILAFGHGPLAGRVDIVGDGAVEYLVSPLQANQMLEARVLFPPSYVPGSTKISTTPMLDKIRQEELTWADQADNERAAGQAHQWRLLDYTIALLATNLALIVILYVRYGKEPKPDWNGTYYRELPADVTPAVVSYLMDGKVQPRDLMATLIDLVRKQYVELQVIEKAGGLFQKDKTDYLFKLINNQTNGLRPHEADAISWFFHQIGQSGEVSLAGIRQYTQKKANAEIFAQRLAKWRAMVIKEAGQKGYFDPSKVGPRIAVIAALAQIVVLIFLYSAVGHALCAVPLLLYGLKMKRRTKNGVTERAKWKAFKRFLHDYSQLASREPLAVHLWEHYFVYAIPLGVAKKVIAMTAIHYEQENRHTIAVYWAATDGGFDRHFEHFAESFDKTVSAAKGNAASRGSGGGFSSGGGGGGGGGGRGAF